MIEPFDQGSSSPSAAPPTANVDPPPALSAADLIAAERARAQAILASPEAAGRGALARKLAFETELSAELSITLLASAPKDVAARPARDRLVVEDPGIKAERPRPLSPRESI